MTTYKSRSPEANTENHVANKEAKKVLVSTTYGTDMSEFVDLIKEINTIFALSNPTAALFAADQRKYFTPVQAKLQLTMATKILANGFDCQFKPQSIILQDLVKKNGSDEALIRKDPEMLKTDFLEHNTNRPYDEQKRHQCSNHRKCLVAEPKLLVQRVNIFATGWENLSGVILQTNDILSNIKESLLERVLPLSWQNMYVLRDPRQIYIQR